MELSYFDFMQDELNMKTLYEDESYLSKIKEDSSIIDTPDKISEIYGDLYLPENIDKGINIFTSFVFSLDGKIAFQDDPKGPVISSNNFLNKSGGKTDFWFLNVLRSYADLVIVGAKTLQAEPDGTSHVFDTDLIRPRLTKLNKKTKHPINLVLTLDGTDVPLDHKIFDCSDLTTWIHTSPMGVEFLKENWEKELTIIDNKEDIDSSIFEEDGSIVVICTGKNNITDPLNLFSILESLSMKQVLVESPAYTWLLIKEKMINEMFINYSGLYVGGDISFGKNYSFTSKKHPHAKLAKISFCSPNFIFTRQKMVYDLTN